jgi:hypothetical protein
MQLWCVRAWEDADDGLEWILLSSLAVTDAKDALEKVEWYRRRWLVEEYHKCLKTGCSMEARQLTSRHALEALLGMLGIVAVHLLELKSSAAGAAPPELVSALSALTKKKLMESEPKEVLREIAKLGGFLARKSDGEPGWTTIWRGWNRLLDIATGLQLAKEMRCG